MKEYLPIGSVVQLKDADRRIMVCGRVQRDSGDGKLYDYSGCLYPEGFVGADQMYIFNNDDIDTVYFVGFQDPEEFKFRENILHKLDESGNLN